MAQSALVWLLRLSALATLSAFGAMIMPTSWMARIHEELGLGPFPHSALVQYLTRSVAALYGFHGVLLALISFNVRRYRPIVVYAGLLNIGLGIMLFAIDRHAALPAFWVWLEGPSLVLVGLLVLALVRQLPRSAPE